MPQTNSSPLPNVGGQQQTPNSATAREGIDQKSLQTDQRVEAAIDKVFRSIQSRLENITSVTQTAQQGAFKAFGNNFVTRGAMQAGGLVGDFGNQILSKFDKRSEEEKDPEGFRKKAFLDAAQTQAKNSTTQVKLLEELLRVGVAGQKQAEAKPEPVPNAFATPNAPPQLGYTPYEEPPPVRAKVSEILDPVEREEPRKQERIRETINVKARTVEPKQELNVDEILDADKIDRPSKKKNDDIIDAEVKVMEDVKRIGMEHKEVQVEELKTNKMMVKLLLGIDKNTAKLAGAQPISTQESELEANAKKLTGDASAIKAAPSPDSSGLSDAAAVGGGGLFGFLASMLGDGLLTALRGALTLLTDGLKKIGSVVMDAGKYIYDTVIDFAGKLGNFAKDMIGKGWEVMKELGGKAAEMIGAGWDKAKTVAGEVAKTAGELGGKAVDLAQAGWDKTKNVASAAGDAIKSGATAVKDFAGSAWDKGKGMLGMGDEAAEAAKAAGKFAKFGKGAMKVIPGLGTVAMVGEGAYDAHEGWNNAEKTLGITDRTATTGEKAASAAGHVADTLSFGLLDKEKTSKWLSETGEKAKQMFSDHENKPAELEDRQRELDRMENMRKNESSSSSGSPTVINTTNVNNSAVFGSRHSTTNQDVSFMRYVNGSFR